MTSKRNSKNIQCEKQKSQKKILNFSQNTQSIDFSNTKDCHVSQDIIFFDGDQIQNTDSDLYFEASETLHASSANLKEQIHSNYCIQSSYIKINSPNQHLETLSSKNVLIIQKSLLAPTQFFLNNSKNQLLVCARKRLLHEKNTYYFFTNQSMIISDKNHSHIGKMVSNHTNTQYSLFSQQNTLLVNFIYTISKDCAQRVQISIYESTLEKSNQSENFSKYQTPLKLMNRCPQRNKLTGKYSTNLSGLALMPSCKNSAIMHQGQNILVMGKVKSKHYNLHYGFPWNDLMALAFAISNYQDKSLV